MHGYHFYEHPLGKLGYRKAGSGSQTLLAFHGFGQDHSITTDLVARLENAYTIYAFDLFFHGQSEWANTELPLTKSSWNEILRGFLLQNQIDRFDLLGFSLGAKFVLGALEGSPHKIDRLILIAPDGIKTNIWYSLATYPLALRWLFKSMIGHPARFSTLVSMAKKLRLSDPGLIRFAESQMDTQEKRMRVYHSWVVFRKLKFRNTAIAHLINHHKIQLVMIVGKFDKVITVKNMNLLLDKVDHHRLEIVEAGHNGLIKKSVELIGNINGEKPVKSL